MTQNITYATAIEQAIDAVLHHSTDDATKNSVIKRLGALKKFELNMGVLSLAMCNIRADAIDAMQAITDKETNPEDVLSKLKQIEKTADNLHNVGSFMALGIACDAAYLLFRGVDNRWPTGISDTDPRRVDIQKIKDGLKITVEPLQGYEDRSSFDPEIFNESTLERCTSSIHVEPPCNSK